MAVNRFSITIGKGVLVAAAATFAIAAIGPMGQAAADDQALPGAPVVRSTDPAVTNAGASEVRASQRGVPLGGVSANTNGGGLVQGGSLSTPSQVGNHTLCNTTAATGFGDGVGKDALLIFDCGSDDIPYN